MNIKQGTILETKRLLLREMNPEIYKTVLSEFTDQNIKEYFGMDSDEELETEKARFQQGITMSGRSFLYFHLIEKQLGNVLGWCGFHTWFPFHKRAELGYVINSDASKGKGYMKEALPDIISYGFNNMNLHRIEALVAPANIPSVKLIKASHFKEEGLLREHYMKNDILEDSAIYSLLRHEFLKE